MDESISGDITLDDVIAARELVENKNNQYLGELDHVPPIVYHPIGFPTYDPKLAEIITSTGKNILNALESFHVNDISHDDVTINVDMKHFNAQELPLAHIGHQIHENNENDSEEDKRSIIKTLESLHNIRRIALLGSTLSILNDSTPLTIDSMKKEYFSTFPMYDYYLEEKLLHEYDYSDPLRKKHRKQNNAKHAAVSKKKRKSSKQARKNNRKK